MTTPDFAEAVRRSKKYIESGFRANFAPTADGEQMMVAMEPTQARLTLGAKLIRRNPGYLFSWALEDAEGFDTAKLAVGYTLEQGEPLPDEARQWLVAMLKGEIFRPKAKAGRKTKEWQEILIWMAVRFRVEEGMTASRNDASEPISACDAVAEALKELGTTPATFEGVKRIWFRMEAKTIPGIPPT